LTSTNGVGREPLEARIAADEDPAQPARAREVVHPFLLARAAST